MGSIGRNPFGGERMMRKPVFKGVAQVALVVKDCMASVKKYVEDYGIGPWSIYDLGPNVLENLVVHDIPQPFAMRAAIAYIGGVMIELIEPLDDNSIYTEFIKEHGEGLHHILFDVEDYGKTVQFFKDKGIGIYQGGTNKGLHFAYFDTRKELGLISEILGGTPDGELPPPTSIYPAPE
jgi:methylmalonyl-CoA/ethylmalonyl-CoA epimerase